MGRPSYKLVVWYKSFLYQAASWNTARWVVVAKEEFHFGELFLRGGLIVTNLETVNRAVSYNKRGRRSSGSSRVAGGKVTRLSCHRFRSNEVRLWLSVMAYNLGKLWRRRVLHEEDREVVPNQLAAKVGEEGGRLVKHPDTAG